MTTEALLGDSDLPDTAGLESSLGKLGISSEKADTVANCISKGETACQEVGSTLGDKAPKVFGTIVPEAFASSTNSDSHFAAGRAVYTLAIFGSPSATKPWMLQFGGHHLGLNIVIAGSRGGLTPTLTGAQPAVYTSGDRKVRVLAGEAGEEGRFTVIAYSSGLAARHRLCQYDGPSPPKE